MGAVQNCLSLYHYMSIADLDYELFINKLGFCPTHPKIYIILL